MSLLELLGESYDPGNIGTFESPDEPQWRPVRSRAAIVVRGVVALTLVGGALAAVLLTRAFAWTTLGITVGALVAYLLLAHFVRPRPDHDNLGWMGGMFDHPFRYSDDINRFLLLLQIVLLPGAFVSESLVDLVRPQRTGSD